jgi:elongation factor G
VRVILEHFETEDGGMEFVDNVKGGNVPREYISNVEAGLREMFQSGSNSGFEFVNVQATLYDGKAHEVDSSEMAFHNAGALAFRQAMDGNTVLLEPYMQLEVRVPEDYMGAVVGDLNSRRGEVGDMDANGDERVIRGLVPISEMFAYASALRGATQGRGSFSMEFAEYRDVPASLAAKALKKDQD